MVYIAIQNMNIIWNFVTSPFFCFFFFFFFFGGGGILKAHTVEYLLPVFKLMYSPGYTKCILSGVPHQDQGTHRSSSISLLRQIIIVLFV